MQVPRTKEIPEVRRPGAPGAGGGVAPRERALGTARLVGSCAASVVALVAVDMPGGYLGSADRLTFLGGAHACLIVVAAGIAILGRARDRPWAPFWAAGILSLNAGIFIPPLASDPLIAGAALLWSLSALVEYVLPAADRPRPSPARVPGTGEDRLRHLGPAARHLATAALFLTVAVVGYELSHQLVPRLICLALDVAALAVGGRFLGLLAHPRRWLAAALLPLFTGLLFLTSPAVSLSILALAQILLLAALIGRTETAAELVRYFLEYPARLVFASFIVLILAGTVLLTFPAAAADGQSISAVDALFTATSAACVTGLIVLDTGGDFSPLGQAVILGLIQVGGLGIMVLSTFAALLLGGSLGLRGEQALRETLETRSGHTAYRLTRFIVLSTLAIETAGAVVLAFSFSSRGMSAGRATWQGLFHSVSAFCNAGFALERDSLVSFQGEPGALLVFALLIVLGGLGFAVLAALGSRIFAGSRQPLSVQARTVLLASAALTLLGWLLYAAWEWNRTLAGLGTTDKLVNALFQSVTARTAGFNTVDLSLLAPATALLIAALMFVGASPGSTGGGIKTTTLVVLLAAIRSMARGGGPTTLFRREVSRRTIDRSLAIVVIAGVACGAALLLLLLVEEQPFEHLFFEAVSAMGTVGLSLGATAGLTAAGKLIVASLMVFGRVSPLTLALVLGTAGSRPGRLRYPRARMMVG